MSRDEIAAELIAGCHEGRTRENIDRLYATDAVSVEAMDMGQGRETRGRDAIKGKHDWWDGAMETLSQRIDGPYPHGPDRFALVFHVEARNKSGGDVIRSEEVAVYHLADGAIVREEFFYRPD
ncbi:nuclear transport factor 2 family protein [Palleronia sediminis]|uniref:Nuclear transport factor 2 family protein n=2 Tax=Palleronia sediminis TaxID=2547833 RepID=A0A4R6AQN1_9RHOB|nr:nuclear transport factor 2 family protein [Palleronia sediminis]TDL84346.1 nuclear transport factor 2 family protein [Palleronia sediminis]